MAKELIDSMIYISKEKLGHLNSILKLTKVQKNILEKKICLVMMKYWTKRRDNKKNRCIR